MDAPSFSGGGTGGVGLMAAVPDARDEMVRLLPGLEFGRQLGRGAYGSVYKARVRKEHASAADSGLRAVKVVEPNKQPRALRERFVRNVIDEIRLLNVASTKWSPCHPNIVRMYSDSRSSATGNFFLVMEYCPGGDLKELLSRYNVLSVEVAKHFMLQLKNALQFMRKEGITHRDLKPANLLLTSRVPKEATIKVADFGLACELSPDSLRETMVGTPLYMAPEVLGKRQYGEKVDLWSAGVILYEMITGRHLYTVESFNELQTAVAEGNPQLTLPPSAKLENAQCKDLLLQLLQSNPEKRMTFPEFYEHPFMQPAPPSMSAFNPGVNANVRKTDAISCAGGAGGESKMSDAGVLISRDPSAQSEPSSSKASVVVSANKVNAKDSADVAIDRRTSQIGSGDSLAFCSDDAFVDISGKASASDKKTTSGHSGAAAMSVSASASSDKLSCSDDWELLDLKDCIGSEEEEEIEVDARSKTHSLKSGGSLSSKGQHEGNQDVEGNCTDQPSQPVMANVSVQNINTTVHDCRDSEDLVPLQAEDTQAQPSNQMNSAESHSVNAEPLATQNSSDSHDETSKTPEASTVLSLEHGAHPSNGVDALQNSLTPAVSSVSVTPMVSHGSPASYDATSKKSEKFNDSSMSSPTLGSSPSTNEDTPQLVVPSSTDANDDIAASEEEPKVPGKMEPKQKTKQSPPDDMEPQISYNSITNAGSIVLFFQVTASQGGNADSSTYMAFHDGSSKNHYLDLNCVEALRARQGTESQLPKYFIGVVIYSEKMAASATQNPFNLAEGVEFTVITAEPIEGVYPQGFGQGRRLPRASEVATDIIKISFRSFQQGDIVLCLPTKSLSGPSDRNRNRRRNRGGNRGGKHNKSSAKDDACKPDVTYVAFSDNLNGSVYTVSPESVAAFKRKNGANPLTFLLGKVIKISKVEDDRRASSVKKNDSAKVSTMADRIEARRKGRKKNKAKPRPKKDCFSLTLSPL
eukprot:g2594.t1